MSHPRVLFVADAGPQVGGGHVMRSLTLANVLSARGAACAFAATPAVAALLDVFASPDIQRVEGAGAFGADLVVLDHYGLSAAEQWSIAGERAIVVIDDMADRLLAADLVLDMGQNRSARDYAGLVRPGTRLLIGPGFALVRPEFAQAREAALTRRRQAGPVRRVLVSLGLTDVGGVTERVIRLAATLLAGCEIDVVVGEETASFAQLSVYGSPLLRLHSQVRDMARMMTEADLSIGAGGSTGWERCTLGLPSLVVVIADNQEPSAQALAAAGAALVVDARDANFEADLQAMLARLAGDADLRLQFAETSAAICDGQGAGRVAEACLRLVS